MKMWGTIKKKEKIKKEKVTKKKNKNVKKNWFTIV